MTHNFVIISYNIVIQIDHTNWSHIYRIQDVYNV